MRDGGGGGGGAGLLGRGACFAWVAAREPSGREGCPCLKRERGRGGGGVGAGAGAGAGARAWCGTVEATLTLLSVRAR